MTDSVTQDLDRYMDEQEQQELEHNKELEQAEDMVSDLHMTIAGLKNHTYEDNTEVIYYLKDDQLVITIDISEVQGEALIRSLDRRSTSTYVAEKTWIDYDYCRSREDEC